MHNAIEAANRANARLNGSRLLFEAAFDEWADAHSHS
jgi:hypothetical protein